MLLGLSGIMLLALLVFLDPHLNIRLISQANKIATWHLSAFLFYVSVTEVYVNGCIWFLEDDDCQKLEHSSSFKIQLLVYVATQLLNNIQTTKN